MKTSQPRAGGPGPHPDADARRIRLLGLCETAQGGVGIYQNLIGGLRDQGFDVHVIAPDQHAWILDEDLPVSRFDRPRRGIGALLRMIATFGSVRRTFRPDICFFHSTFALPALAYARLRGVRGPLIYCAHGWAVRNYAPGSLKGRVVRLIEGRLCGLADVVINVSQAEKSLAEHHGYRGRHIVVDNAVPEARPDARGDLFADRPDETHLLFVGRFDRQKGLDLLLPAFAAAREVRPDLTLHVVGDGVRSGFEVDRDQPGVQFAGWVPSDRIDDWYRSADALVVPSRWEGLPLVIPEAYRNGTPVLCSTASGMDALVDHGRTGTSFDLTPQAITAALLAFSREDLRSMREAARQRYLDRYRISRLREELAGVLQELVRR